MTVESFAGRGLWLAAACVASLLPGMAAAEVFSPPDGSVAVHYYRPDGAYKGWGLHAWESFEKTENGKVVAPKTRSDAPLENVSWGAPLEPTGKDDFGSYWVMKIGDFRNHKVNFIVHKGDSKACGKDLSFFVEDTRQVFMNHDDCTVFLNADDAAKARK